MYIMSNDDIKAYFDSSNITLAELSAITGKTVKQLKTILMGQQIMIVFNYKSKKELKEHIGQQLDFIETSMFGAEYVRDGAMVGANRPHITGKGREFFAEVTMANGFIKAVK